MAPILSFTAEEAWRIVHPEDPTVFVRTGRTWSRSAGAAALLAKWSEFSAVRAQVQTRHRSPAADGGRGLVAAS